MDKNQILDELAAQVAQIAENQRAALQNAKSALLAEIERLDNAWSETEHKHQSALMDSKSDAWTHSLSMVRNERLKKYDANRARLVALLSELPVDPELPAIDFEMLNLLLDTIDTEISKYQSTLSIKRRQLEFAGDYGGVENAKWLAEISRFAEMNPEVSICIKNLQAICHNVSTLIDWQNYVICRINDKINPADHLPEPAISDGIGFEHSCLAALKQSGWEGNLTKSSGDQGVDIIVRKGDRSVAIQCKNYKTPVGNGAVQEVHAGKAFYEAEFAVVVSPSGFTVSAVQLAQKLGVLLVDPSTLNTLEKIL